MNEENNLFSATGIPSLFLIFAVLMLVILSLLGYGTSRQDLQSSTLSLKQTTAYYDACSQATDFYSDMLLTLKKYQTQAEEENQYYQMAARYFAQTKDATWDPDTHTVRYRTGFSDTQSLVVEIAVSWYNPDRNVNSCPARILSWNTIVTADWNPDNSQPVYKGD